MKWNIAKALLTGISMILLLSACTSTGGDMAPVSESVREQLQQSKEDQGQTITLKKTTDSNINKGGGQAAEVGYKIQTRLTDFQLLSAKAGLAWGITRNELRIYVTQDNGKTWDNVSPAKTVTFSESPVYGSSIFFLNQKNGWVARNANGVGQTLILHTIDGGQNWNVQTFNNDATVLGMYFVDEKTGWVMTSSDAANNKQEKALYRTQDGGQNWVKLMQNTGDFAASNSTPNAIPQTGTLVGMSFRSAQNGFVTLEDNGMPRLYTTADGGKSWSEGKELVPKDVDTCDRLTTGKPQFFGSSKTKGWMNIGCVIGSQTHYFGYFTIDGGKSWSLAPFSLQPQSGINQSMGPTFLNEQTGWSVINGVIFRTDNQGKNWTALPKSDTLQKTLVNYPELVKLQFFSREVGWLLVSKNEERRSLLMQTTDGGKTWHVL